jgi:hypothetical protein
MLHSLPDDIFTPCASLSANPNESAPVTMITRTFQLTATDPLRLQQRLRALKEALGIRGGKITTLQWKNSSAGKHSVKVRYEMPDSLPALCG